MLLGTKAQNVCSRLTSRMNKLCMIAIIALFNLVAFTFATEALGDPGLVAEINNRLKTNPAACCQLPIK